MARETRAVTVQAGDVQLEGDLGLPDGSRGIVLFVHGSGSSRKSPRNRAVAARLREGGLATLLFDLLTPAEEQVDAVTRHLRFDIALLAGRTVAAVDWLRARPETAALSIGAFGASTGAAAALIAAAERPGAIGAVVSRGGRPDLAVEALDRVRAPTLLIVGGEDHVVIGMNDEALAALPPDLEKRLDIVPGATHLFEEPGALEEVTRLARDWFASHLSGPSAAGVS